MKKTLPNPSRGIRSVQQTKAYLRRLKKTREYPPRNTYCRFLAALGIRLPRTDGRQVSRLADRHTLKPSHPGAFLREGTVTSYQGIPRLR